MLKIAITGNIASGKSEVEKILLKSNYSVLDTDEVAHNLLMDFDIKNKIIETFKGYDLLDNGELSRKKLGELIFPNKILRQKLEYILHPEILKKIELFLVNEEKVGNKFAFVSVPLLFEANFDKYFDKIVLVYADDNIRRNRLMNRNNLTIDYAQNRLDIQISQDKKVSMADYIIYNNSSVSELENAVSAFIKSL